MALTWGFMGLFAAKETIDVKVTGMTCGNCVRHVTEALEGVPGVVGAVVSLDDGRAAVTVKAGKVDAAALRAAVAEAGYEAA